MSATPSEAQDPSTVPAPLSLHRLERLTDFVFGLALVCLLLTIDFAPEQQTSSAEAYGYFVKQISQSLAYAINFIIIAYYWIINQEYFRYYTGTNKTHSFIELIYLMTIAGMPFNNHFIAAFPTETAPRLALSSDMVAAGVLAYLSWAYASHNNRLIDTKECNAKMAIFMRRQALVMPICAVVSAGAVLIHPYAWDVVLTFGPPLAIYILKKRS